MTVYNKDYVLAAWSNTEENLAFQRVSGAKAKTTTGFPPSHYTELRLGEGTRHRQAKSWSLPLHQKERKFRHVIGKGQKAGKYAAYVALGNLYMFAREVTCL